MQSFSKVEPGLTYPFSSVAHKRTLILGDLSSGKTVLTARMLVDALKSEDLCEITIIDLAPEKVLYNRKALGGRIADELRLPLRLRVLQPRKINTPRFSAKNSSDLLRQVEENHAMIEEIIDLYLGKPTPILFVNDVSLYLQSGKFEKIFKLIEEADTFIANAYYGMSLKDDLGTGISALERQLVEGVARQVDLVIHL